MDVTSTDTPESGFTPVDRSDYTLCLHRADPDNRDETLDLSRTALHLTDQRPVIREMWSWWHQLWATFYLPAAGLEDLTPEQLNVYLLTHLNEALRFHGSPGLKVFRDPSGNWAISLSYRLFDMDLGE